MRIIFVTLITMLLSSFAFAQGQPNKSSRNAPSPVISQRQVVELPRPEHKPPKLTLQQALKIAERFIAKEKIDISSYYLFEAKWVLYGTDAKEPRWYFWWVNVDDALGHYVETTVSMEGRPQLQPSM